MIRAVSLTDIGKKRKLNQDYVYVSQESIGSLENIFVVADGMGGHNAGDFASKYTVEKVIDEIRKSAEPIPVRILDMAIQAANDDIRRHAEEDETLYGMGTTIVAATLNDRHLQVANVGDSRLYIVSRDAGSVRQITRDHSLVEEMVRMGGMDKETAKNHPDKHIITRAVGAKSKVDVDFFSEELNNGDMILLCSDGLSNMLEDEEIGSILCRGTGLAERAAELIKAANDNGGRDNIAVIIIDPFSES